MTKNKIEYGIREKYVGVGRLKECHFQYRYGTDKQFTAYLGGLRIPISSRKQEEQFINAVTKALADIWGLNPPKKNHK